jgi:hypothetical protein
MTTPPNHAVEATAPRRLSFGHHEFYNIIVPVGAALTGAVPHLGRWLKEDEHDQRRDYQEGS